MAVPDRIKLFRAQTSRSVGGNARRMSHAPAAPEMLEIYDRLGIMVLDENRGDGPNGYPFGAVVNDDPSWATNLGVMIRRDRNHPSVILWVYCNEDGCDAVDNATATLWQDIATENDLTRPTAGNRNGNPTLNAHVSSKIYVYPARPVIDPSSQAVCRCANDSSVLRDCGVMTDVRPGLLARDWACLRFLSQAVSGKANRCIRVL